MLQEINHMRTCMGGSSGLYIKRRLHENHHNYSYIVLLFFGKYIVVLFIVLSTLMASSSSSTTKATTAPTDPSTAVLIRVDQSGQGNYRKIQDAIDAVPSNNTEFVFIWVKPGTYR